MMIFIFKNAYDALNDFVTEGQKATDCQNRHLNPASIENVSIMDSVVAGLIQF